MHAPQIIFIVLMAIGFNDAVLNHGKEKKRIINAWASMIAYSLTTGLLYWGGFFSH